MSLLVGVYAFLDDRNRLVAVDGNLQLQGIDHTADGLFVDSTVDLSGAVRGADRPNVQWRPIDRPALIDVAFIRPFPRSFEDQTARISPAVAGELPRIPATPGPRQTPAGRARRTVPERPIPQGRQDNPSIRQTVQPLPKEGSADDVVGAVVWLAGDAGSYVTGRTIVVDRGWTVR